MRESLLTPSFLGSAFADYVFDRIGRMFITAHHNSWRLTTRSQTFTPSIPRLADDANRNRGIQSADQKIYARKLQSQNARPEWCTVRTANISISLFLLTFSVEATSLTERQLDRRPGLGFTNPIRSLSEKKARMMVWWVLLVVDGVAMMATKAHWLALAILIWSTGLIGYVGLHGKWWEIKDSGSTDLWLSDLGQNECWYISL